MAKVQKLILLSEINIKSLRWDFILIGYKLPKTKAYNFSRCCKKKAICGKH